MKRLLIILMLAIGTSFIASVIWYNTPLYITSHDWKTAFSPHYESIIKHDMLWFDSESPFELKWPYLYLDGKKIGKIFCFHNQVWIYEIEGDNCFEYRLL